MAALTQNDLKGYIIGTNQFNFQDARVDDLENIANIISRTQGEKGIEVRNNRLALTNGGYYETGALFEDTGNEYELDSSVKTSYSYDVSGMPQEYLDWIAASNQANVWIMGSNGDTEIEEELEGSFSVNEEEATFELFDANASLGEYGIQSIKVDLTNMTFYINKETDNEDILTLTEIAVYLPGSDPVQWPTDLIDVVDIENVLTNDISNSEQMGDDIYQAIVARLIDEGYIQSQM